jgi:hypothetical protein
VCHERSQERLACAFLAFALDLLGKLYCTSWPGSTHPFTRHGGRAGEYLLRLEIKQILCPPFDLRSNGQRLAKKDRARPVRIEAHR